MPRPALHRAFPHVPSRSLTPRHSCVPTQAYRRALESVLEAVLGRVATAVDAAGRAADAAYATVSAALRASRWIALHVVVAVIVGAFCLATAVGIYALVYSFYIPTLSHTFPIYFQFEYGRAPSAPPTRPISAFRQSVRARFAVRQGCRCRPRSWTLPAACSAAFCTAIRPTTSSST